MMTGISNEYDDNALPGFFYLLLAAFVFSKFLLKK